jgi:hypothetical protein
MSYRRRQFRLKERQRSYVPLMLNFLTNRNTYETALGYIDNKLPLIGDLNGDEEVNNADLQSLLDFSRLARVCHRHGWSVLGKLLTCRVTVLGTALLV